MKLAYFFKTKIRIISFVLLSIIVLSQCNQSEITEGFTDETATIHGAIVNYKGIYKSGKLGYFDAISRLTKNEIITIDSLGSFTVSFEIPHAIYNVAYLDIEGKYYNLFLEPGKDLEVVFKNGNISFPGENGLENRQLQRLVDSLNSHFGEEDELIEMIYTKGLSDKAYIDTVRQLSNRELRYLKDYSERNPIERIVFNAVYKDIYYRTAESWINNRFDYSQGFPEKRDSLPHNFYTDLFDAFPVNDKNAIYSSEYIDYISNIGKVLEEDDNILNRLGFYQKSGYFSDPEINLIKGIFEKDTSVLHSREFKNFNTEENLGKLRELSARFAINNLFNRIERFPEGIGRDMIISQAISRNYFSRGFIPVSDEEWQKISNLVHSGFIINYLRDIENNIKVKSGSGQTANNPSEKQMKEAQVKNKDIIGKYVGKVIYVDFWSTWCGPCRFEVPYSKMLMKQFKDEDVVFLYLCCQSKKEDWINFRAQFDFNGEHYLLNHNEQILLSSLYEVNGYPTYVLIDKKGNVYSKNAPKPSSEKEIINEINKLLKKG